METLSPHLRKIISQYLNHKCPYEYELIANTININKRCLSGYFYSNKANIFWVRYRDVKFKIIFNKIFCWWDIVIDN
jgi:hypothetical protein